MSSNLKPRRSKTAIAGAAGLTAGLVLGGVGIAAAATSSSSTSTPSSTSAAAPPSGTSSSSEAPMGGPAGGPHGGYQVPGMSGTVTNVGTDTVTIKTASGTTTYAVNSSSDIDKNGEATLSDLIVGDAVTFNTTGSGSSLAIDKLHAGSEALDRPSGPRGGGPGGPGSPRAPSSTGPAGTTSA